MLDVLGKIGVSVPPDQLALFGVIVVVIIITILFRALLGKVR
jgi:hypothetical protein